MQVDFSWESHLNRGESDVGSQKEGGRGGGGREGGWIGGAKEITGQAYIS